MADGRGHPQPGDLIEIDRKVYQHWALYVGDGYVIHVTDDEGARSSLGSSSSVSAAMAKVKKQLLKEVAGNDDWRVNNKYDRSRTPRPVEEIILRAERWVDMEVPYGVLTNNCEHFVTMLRYGEGRSDQAKAALIRITKAAVGSICILAGLTSAGVTTAVVTGTGCAAAVAVKAFSMSTGKQQ